MNHFTARRRVEFSDTDMAGMMHFANFFRFMESAEHEYLASRGLRVIWNDVDERLGFPRVSASCDYLQPAHYLDELEIDVTVDRVGEKSLTLSFDFRRGSDLVAKGEIVTVCCRVNTEGRVESIPIPETFRSKLTAK
ncbi:MAG: acyl-CoA thioesterase [Gemmataceae bacterium]